MGHGRRTAACLWLCVVCTVALACVTYHVAEQQDQNRAGHDPGFTGLVAVVPFVLLAMLQALCAAFVGPSVTRRSQAAGVWAATLAAWVMVALVAGGVTLHVRRGYPVANDVPGAALLVAGLLLPLAPAWASHRRTPRDASAQSG